MEGYVWRRRTEKRYPGRSDVWSKLCHGLGYPLGIHTVFQLSRSVVIECVICDDAIFRGIPVRYGLTKAQLGYAYTFCTVRWDSVGPQQPWRNCATVRHLLMTRGELLSFSFMIHLLQEFVTLLFHDAIWYTNLARIGGCSIARIRYGSTQWSLIFPSFLKISRVVPSKSSFLYRKVQLTVISLIRVVILKMICTFL